MRVLFVSHLYPWPPVTGNPIRVYHLVRALATRHRVTLVALSDRPNPPAAMGLHTVDDPVTRVCERVIWVSDRTSGFNTEPPASASRLPEHLRRRIRVLATSPLPWRTTLWQCPELVHALRALRTAERFDAVWVERSYIAEMVKRAGFRRVVVDLDDLGSVAQQRLLRVQPWNGWTPLLYAELAKEYAYERLLPSRFERLVVCKEADRQFFGRRAAQATVVPNGIDEYPAADPSAERPGEVMFTGLMGYPPNIDAALHFVRSVLPRLKARCVGVRFTVVGVAADRALRSLRTRDDCVVVGRVPDMGPYYGRASVVVVPMRLGSGTRIKVLEALARGKAVVSTSVGAEGLDLRPGVDLEIADDPAAFAEACARLLGDPAARLRLGESGRARVLQLYQWQRVAEAAHGALAAVAAEGAELACGAE